jgi:DNA-binding YbaB/EbfC family protein
MVTITLTGKGEMRKIKLDKSLADPEEVEMLEDLILAAYNDARGKVEDHVATEMAKVTGGLKLPPGMKLPF